MVRGYHVYKDIWDAVVGDELQCIRETSNRHDPFAVAVVKNMIVVGHVPRKLSAMCSLFLRRNGCIMCRVTGSRRYSGDLPQGGLEIPCMLVFTGESAQIEKLHKGLKKTSVERTSEVISKFDDVKSEEPARNR